MAQHLLTLKPAPPRDPVREFASELFRRHPLLAGYAGAALVLGLACLLATLVDPRRIGQVSVWLKPAKFYLSIGVFVATTAWFFGYLQPKRRRSLLAGGVVAVLLATATFELAWITFQGARGEASHFNFSTGFTSRMYAAMGIAAVLLSGTTLPLAWEIARRPAPGVASAYRLSVVLGLVLTFLLGATAGGLISKNGAAAVGLHASTIPIFQWNQIGGDLRIAHFLGIHAQQALPLFGWLIVLGRLRHKHAAVVAIALGYSALTIGGIAASLFRPPPDWLIGKGNEGNRAQPR